MSTQGITRLHSPPTTQISFQQPESFSTLSGRKTPSNFSLFSRPSNTFSLADRNQLQSPTPSQKSASGLKRATSWLKGRFHTKPTK